MNKPTLINELVLRGRSVRVLTNSPGKSSGRGSILNSSTESDSSADGYAMGDSDRINSLENQMSRVTEDIQNLLRTVTDIRTDNQNSRLNPHIPRPSTSNVNENIDNTGVGAQGGQPLDATALGNIVVTKKNNPLVFDVDLMIDELETALSDDPNIKRRVPIRERKLITEYLRVVKYHNGEPFTDEDLLATKEQLRLLYAVFQHGWPTALQDKKEGSQQRLGIEFSATALQAKKPYTRGRGRGRNYGRGYRSRGRGRGAATSGSSANPTN